MVYDPSALRPAGEVEQPKEVAVFVDFENIRYSTINSYGREPDPIDWRDKAMRYGLMSVARAYADFDQHPPQARTRLDVAGFEAQHYPAKRSTDSLGREKLASRSDLNFAVDIINTALTRPDIEIFMLFTGDKDFIRLVTTLRNRLGRRVIICGVPGSVSPDLVIAAGGEDDPIEVEQSGDIDVVVIKAIDAYVAQLHEGFVPTQSHMSRTLWRFLDRNALPSEHIEAKVMEFLRKGILTKRPTINGQGQELVTTELNLRHPMVIEALPRLAQDHSTDDEDSIEYGDDYEDSRQYALDPDFEVTNETSGEVIGQPDSDDEESAASFAPGNAARESGYSRRFSSGNGSWRGRTNVRSGLGES